MKKKDLIKKIAFEYNINEIEVSEYFDNIFETLAITFTKNKNVNISEFGKFNVKGKLDEEGKERRTVLFSPVKKFANEVNYNFNELSPVQIRVLDEKSISDKSIEEEYPEDEIEEIIFIDFEEEKIPAVKEDISSEAVNKEEILIFEETTQEILHEEIPFKEEPEETIKEEILITEETVHEIPCETIPEEVKDEIVSIITSDADKVPELLQPALELAETIKERDRIFDELDKIVIPEVDYQDFIDKVEHTEIISRDKRVISEVISIIKEEEISEEIKELEEILKEKEIEEPEAPIIEESKEEQDVISIEDEITDEITPILKTCDDNKEQETQKTSLELEAELLKMLDERKKILEEIKKLESTDSDELVDISEKSTDQSDGKPKLFDESTLDHPKQNIFVDEEGKALEDLLNKIVGFDDISKETVKEEDIIPETRDEQREEIIPEEKIEPIKEDFELKESIEDKGLIPDKEIDGLVNLLGSLYEEKTEEISLPEPKEVEPHLNNLEMKVFDKLLDESVKQPQEEISIPLENANKNGVGQDLMSIDELESMFKNFKTEISEPQQSINEVKEDIQKEYEKKEVEKKEVEKKEIKKTETIKTYDDIFNLLEPNGKKKEIKPAEVVAEPRKKMSPVIKIFILFGITVLVIIFCIYLYKKLVYKPSDETTQTQVTQTADVKNTANNDSIIYADTNKMKETIKENIVYDENGIVIKESEKGFFIHLGNFENQYELAKKIKELKDKNIFPSYEEVTVEGKQIYKIKLGPYKSLKDAKDIIPKL
jgi:nucleoid DNA-binding protein